MARIGIIGCGMIGHAHAMCLKTLGMKPQALCDENGKHLAEIQRQFDVEFATTDYQQVLDNEQVEAVIISVPNHLHHELTLKAAVAGKHILVEKPMALTANQCDQMIAACKENAVCLLVGYFLRWHDQHQKLNEIVGRDEVGRILSVRTRMGANSVGNVDGTWRSRYRFSKHQSGGGALMDWSHDIDLHRWIFGEITEVFAFIGNLVFGKEYQSETEDIGNVVFKYETGALGVMCCDYLVDAPWAIEIGGDKGSIYGERHPRNWMCLTKGEAKKQFTFGEDKSHLRQMKHFIDCIRGRAEPLVSGKDGKKVVKIIQAAYQSVETARRVIL